MTRDQWADVGERVWATFWQGAVAAAPLTFVPDLDWVEQTVAAMAIGGGGALLAMLKGMVKSRRT